METACDGRKKLVEVRCTNVSVSEKGKEQANKLNVIANGESHLNFEESKEGIVHFHDVEYDENKLSRHYNGKTIKIKDNVAEDILDARKRNAYRVPAETRDKNEAR